VLPIDGSGLQRMTVARPQVAETREQYTFRPGTQTVPFFAGPRVLNRPHSVTADATIPAGGAEGVLLSQGTAVGGWTFYMKDGRLHYLHNYVRRSIHRVSSPDPVPEGRHELRFEFEPTGAPDIPNGKGAPGVAQLYVDGELVAENDIPVTIPILIAPGGMTCGADPGSPVSPDYQAPFRFTGELHTVSVDLSGQLIDDHESELRVAMARQ
jgi:arylsulfatase